MIFNPLLRGFTNPILRSDAMSEIRDDFKYEMWEMEDRMLVRLDEMMVMMRRFVDIAEQLLANVEAVKLLASTILSTDILTSEQMAQILTKVSAASKARLTGTKVSQYSSETDEPPQGSCLT